jgi:hypothetical protein
LGAFILHLTFKATVSKKGQGESCAAGLMDKYFPHPALRPHQGEAIEFAHRVVSDGEIGLLDSRALDDSQRSGDATWFPVMAWTS